MRPARDDLLPFPAGGNQPQASWFRWRVLVMMVAAFIAYQGIQSVTTRALVDDVRAELAAVREELRQERQKAADHHRLTERLRQLELENAGHLRAATLNAKNRGNDRGKDSTP